MRVARASMAMWLLLLVTRGALAQDLPPAEPLELDAVADPTAAFDLDPTGHVDPADRGLDPAEPGPVELSPASTPAPTGVDVTCGAGTERRAVGKERFCVDAAGRRQGPWLRLHPSGAVAARGAYEQGAREGLFSTYYPSGALETRVPYALGREEGMSEQFYEDGARRVSTELHQGVPEGRQTLWHPNGNKRAEGVYRQGRRHGVWTWYAEDGRVLRTTEFDAGLAVVAREAAAPMDRVPAAVAGGVGASVGLLAGTVTGLLLVNAGILRPGVPFTWLVGLTVPLVATAAGAAFGLSLFTPLPAALLVGVASGLAVPVGGVAGGILGVVVGGAIGTAVAVASGTGGSNTLSLLLYGGGAVGAVVGAVGLPVAVASGVGWALADEEALGAE